jgi:prolyl 4-hydroxylase
MDNMIFQFVINNINSPKDLRGDLSALKFIEHFFSPTECQFFRDLIDKNATEQLSNRSRLIIDSNILADWFWNRLEPYNEFTVVIDEYGDKWIPIGVNNRFRINRYEKGQSFPIHEDTIWWPKWNEKSFVTAMVYLNDIDILNSSYIRGQTDATYFYRFNCTVEPEEGLLISFLVNNLDHCGLICSGDKYVFRTDIMYQLCTDQMDDKNLKRRHQLFAEFDAVRYSN